VTGVQTCALPISPIALMLGRLSRHEDYKGHREVIKTWPLVLQNMPNAELWIVGDGDLRPALESLVKAYELEAKVRFWGCVTEEVKQELLARSRCLVLPSRGEGFGLVYLEAMRLGRPCLVSTSDAGREVINPPEAGLAIDPQSPQMIADALCKLLADNSKWKELSKCAKRRYEAMYTAKHFQERLLSALFSLYLN